MASQTIQLKINADNQSIGFSGNKLCLKISSKANNGLSFSNGKLIGTKAADGSSGSGGSMNTPGNGLGPVNSTESTSLEKVGFNSTVSRKKKYTGTNQFINDNDGPVIAKFDGSGNLTRSIALYMIGGGE